MLFDIGTSGKCLNSTSTKFTKLHEKVNVKLKEPTSITHPHFMVHLNGISDIYKCNYMHNTNWGYYWIDDIIYETNDIATLICHRDVLATGKSLITQTEAYVNYMSLIHKYNAPFNQDDPRVNPDVQYSYREMYPIANMAGMSFSSEGCVLIKTLAFTNVQPAQAESGIVTYIMPVISFMEMARMCADQLINNLQDAVRYLLGDNLKDNLLCARWLPLDFGSVKTKYGNNTTHNINLAGFFVTVSNEVVCFDSISQLENMEGTIDLNFADSGLTKEYPFLRGERFTRIQFVHPGGNLDVSSDDFITSGDQINFKLSIDMCSGDYAIKIKPAGGTGTGIGSGVLSGNTYPIITGSIATDWTNYWSTMSNPGLKVAGAAIKGIAAVGTMALGSRIDFGSAGTDYDGFGYTEAGGYGMYSAKSVDIGRIGTGGVSAALTGIGGAIQSSAHNGRTYNSSVSSNIMTCHALVGNGENMGHMFRFEVSIYVPHMMAQNSETGTDYYPSFCKKYGYATFADVPMNLLNEAGKSYYVQCAGFNLLNTSSSTAVTVSRVLTPKEIAEINTLMNSGVIIE